MLATLGQVCELQPTRISPRQPSGNSQAEDSLFSEPGCIHDCPHQYARGVNNYLILQYAKLIFGLYQAAVSQSRHARSGGGLGRLVARNDAPG